MNFMNDGFQNFSEILMLQSILPKETLALILPLFIFFDKFNKYYMLYSYRLYNYFNINKEVHYVIESHIVPIISYDMKYEKPTYKLKFSKDFKAIIHYIQMNLKELSFSCLYECIDENMDVKKYKIGEKNKKEDSFIYLPIYANKQLIDKENKIYFELSQDENDDKKMVYYCINLTMKYSVKHNNLVILQDFVKKCVKEYEEYLNNQECDKTQYIYTYMSSYKDDDGLNCKYEKHECLHNKDLNSNIFIEDKEKLINYIKPFINLNYSEKYSKADIEYKELVKTKYIRSGITFKSGLLFYGSPGCGKTSCIKGILNYTNRHGILINLDKISRAKDLETIFRNTTYNGVTYKREELCFILEDCDATEKSFIYSRKLINHNNNDNDKENNTNNSIDNSDKPNLTTFLNILDGIIELNDVMIIMTTNHPELIDEALIRPGRFDFKYEFKKTSTKIITEMLMFKYDLSYCDVVSHNDYKKLKDYKLSHAYVQSIMFQNNFEDTIRILGNKCNE